MAEAHDNREISLQRISLNALPTATALYRVQVVVTCIIFCHVCV